MSGSQVPMTANAGVPTVASVNAFWILMASAMNRIAARLQREEDRLFPARVEPEQWRDPGNLPRGPACKRRGLRTPRWTDRLPGGVEDAARQLRGWRGPHGPPPTGDTFRPAATVPARQPFRGSRQDSQSTSLPHTYLNSNRLQALGDDRRQRPAACTKGNRLFHGTMGGLARTPTHHLRPAEALFR